MAPPALSPLTAMRLNSSACAAGSMEPSMRTENALKFPGSSISIDLLDAFDVRPGRHDQHRLPREIREVAIEEKGHLAGIDRKSVV